MMENSSRIPILKGKPFFDQLKLSINFIDTNMKLIDNSVKTSNTDEEYNYVKKVIGNVDKLIEDVNNLARGLKVNNCLKRNSSKFEDEIQNLKDTLRCKEMDYQLEPFKYQQSISKIVVKSSSEQNTVILNQDYQLNNKQFSQFSEPTLESNNELKKSRIHKFDHKLEQNKESSHQMNNRIISNATVNLNSLKNQNFTHSINSSLNSRDTFVLKENKDNLVKKPAQFIAPSRKDLIKDADMTNESIDQNNQYSFEFKLPYNKLKNNYHTSNNFSVDESLEIEFTPGLKSRRTGKKKQFNESNASIQEMNIKNSNNCKENFRDSYRDAHCKDTDYIKPSSPFIKNEPTMKHDLDKLNSQHTYLKEDDLSLNTHVKNEIKSPLKVKNTEFMDDSKTTVLKHKLSTPKKPPNFDIFEF